MWGEYYENGQIKGKGQYASSNCSLFFPHRFCKIGRWVYYDEEGNITAECWHDSLVNGCHDYD